MLFPVLVRRALTTPPVVRLPVAPKPFRPVRFLFRTTLYVGGATAAVAYAALNNDDVNDFLVERVPYAEEALGKAEEWYKGAKSIDFDKTFGQLSDVKERVKHKFESTKAAAAGAAGAATAAPAKPEPLKVTVRSLSPVVQAAVESINALLKLMDKAGTTTPAVARATQQSLQRVAETLENLTRDYDATLAKAAEEQKTLLAEVAKTAAAEETAKLVEQFNKETQELVAKHQRQVAEEVRAATDALAAQADNKVAAVQAGVSERLALAVEQAVSSERNGRLANLEQLAAEVDGLAAVVAAVEKEVETAAAAKRTHTQVQALRAKVYGSEPVPLRADVERLLPEVKDNELAVLALTLLPATALDRGVLTVPQLAARWQLLVPELRSAALLPPNAGLLGHFAAAVFAKLLVPKLGVSSGDDIESVIARVDAALQRGEVADAVEEVAGLKGWGRKLADGWVVEGRLRVEVEMLVGLL